MAMNTLSMIGVQLYSHKELMYFLMMDTEDQLEKYESSWEQVKI